MKKAPKAPNSHGSSIRGTDPNNQLQWARGRLARVSGGLATRSPRRPTTLRFLLFFRSAFRPSPPGRRMVVEIHGVGP